METNWTVGVGEDVIFLHPHTLVPDWFGLPEQETGPKLMITSSWRNRSPHRQPKLLYCLQ